MAEPSQSKGQKDRYEWAPWAVLAALILMGLLGFFGVLTPKQKGPTAADVPFIPTSASAAAPARPAP